MSFGLGIMAGFGGAMRAENEARFEANMSAEKQKNEATANLLHDFMLRDDVTPETRQAALQSLMQFSQTKGIPTQKHRQAAMEPLLTSFNAPRTAPEANTLNAAADASPSPSSSAYASSPASAPGAPTPLDAARANVRTDTMHDVASSVPPRTGFLQSDEMALKKGHAAGLQMKSTYDTMGMGSGMPGMPGTGSGAPGGAPNSMGGASMMMTPDGKFHLVQPSVTPVQARYLDSDGNVQEGFINYDHRYGRGTDGNGHPVVPIALMTRDGYITMSGTNAAGAPIKTVETKTAAATAGPQAQFVRKVPVRGETLSGDQTLTSFNPVTGAVAPNAAVIGRKANVDVARERAVAGIESTLTNTKAKKIATNVTYDPNAFPDVAAAPGQPIVDTQSGPQPIGTRQFAATKEPGQVLTRASAARSVDAQAQKVAAMVEDPKNANLMGKVSGRVSELLTEGPQMFAAKWIGPIGTNDPRLAELHAAVKSISDLLTTVHGRRAEEAAQNFARTMKMVNSPQALAAAIRQYQRIAQQISTEGNRPVTQVTGGAHAVPARTSATATATAPAATTFSPKIEAGITNAMNKLHLTREQAIAEATKRGLIK